MNNFFKTLDKSTKRFLIVLSLVATCCILINLFVCQIAIVNGNSMYPTLKNNQMLIVNKISTKYERNSIIVFKTKSGYLIKRVIGLPGEEVKIQNNDIYINGNKIDDVVKIDMNDYGIAKDGVVLGDDEYFVLGDNRNFSTDSRFIGCIKEKDINGIVNVSLFPFEKYNNKK